MAEQQHEGDLPQHSMGLVHAVEAAEERLDDPQTRAEHEVERERGRTGERAQNRDARQACKGAAEASFEWRGACPEQERRRAERGEHNQATKWSKLPERRGRCSGHARSPS